MCPLSGGGGAQFPTGHLAEAVGSRGSTRLSGEHVLSTEKEPPQHPVLPKPSPSCGESLLTGLGTQESPACPKHYHCHRNGPPRPLTD